jgi:hypothetical protein
MMRHVSLIHSRSRNLTKFRVAMECNSQLASGLPLITCGVRDILSWLDPGKRTGMHRTRDLGGIPLLAWV